MTTTQIQTAQNFLTRQLASGSRRADLVVADAGRARIGVPALARAMAAIGVTYRERRDGSRDMILGNTERGRRG